MGIERKFEFPCGASLPMPEASAPLSPRVRAKRRRRRAEILQAALLAFRERGYHATTLDDIANRLGLRKTALYHYFPDKEAILYACHLESLGASTIAASASAGVRALSLAAEQPYRVTATALNVRSGPGTGYAILGAVNWIARWYRPGGPIQTQELGARFAEQLLGGLTCTPGP